MLSLLLTTVVALSQPVAPAPDGLELLTACRKAVALADDVTLEAADLMRAAWCTGYLGGFLDGLKIMGWKGGATKVCLPSQGIVNEQLARIVVKHLEANPEKLHQSGRTLVVVAIARAFPC